MPKISLRNKRILILAFSLLLLAACYFFVYQPLMEKGDKLAEEAAALEEKYQSLLDIQEKEEFYRSETASMQAEIGEYTSKFPADIRPENSILLGTDLEVWSGITVTNLAFGDREFLYSVDGVMPQSEEQDQTLSEENNEATRQALAELEGETADETMTYQPAGDSMSLYRVTNNVSYTGSYQNLKDLIRYLNTRPERMTVDSMNAAFDSGTGNLSGSVTINQFFMTGTTAVYSEPELGGIGLGRENIFGTISE